MTVPFLHHYFQCFALDCAPTWRNLYMEAFLNSEVNEIRGAGEIEAPTPPPD